MRRKAFGPGRFRDSLRGRPVMPGGHVAGMQQPWPSGNAASAADAANE